MVARKLFGFGTEKSWDAVYFLKDYDRQTDRMLVNWYLYKAMVFYFSSVDVEELWLEQDGVTINIKNNFSESVHRYSNDI